MHHEINENLKQIYLDTAQCQLLSNMYVNIHVLSIIKCDLCISMVRLINKHVLGIFDDLKSSGEDLVMSRTFGEKGDNQTFSFLNG